MFDNLRENFELILVVLFLVSAIAYVVYRLTFYKDIQADIKANKTRLSELDKKSRKNLRGNITASHINTFKKKFIFFFADLFWVLLFVVVLRSFLYEPFKIPSGSMKPGLQIGDIILVNKYEKGLRLPVTNQRLTDGEPIKRGDVIVFKYPNDTTKSYIKRVIGLPGDTVHYDNRTLTINGKKVNLKEVGIINDNVEIQTAYGKKTIPQQFTKFEESLPNMTHTLRYAKSFQANYPTRTWTVPAGKYLMFGDNRDQSSDGRDWGYVDDSLIVGHAVRIALNWDCFKGNGKCNRFFKKIY